MKHTSKIIAFLLLSLASSYVIAQKKTQWEALDAMKVVMKQTFPPMLKNNDLQPARKNSQEMVRLAINLANADKPKYFKKKKMEGAFKQIVEDAQKMEELVRKNASDDELKIALSSLHGSFAEIAHHEKLGSHEHH